MAKQCSRITRVEGGTIRDVIEHPRCSLVLPTASTCCAQLSWDDEEAWGDGYYSAAEGDAYIINGNDVEKGRWPWMLSLEVLDPEYRHTCGASLLGQQTVPFQPSMHKL